MLSFSRSFRALFTTTALIALFCQTVACGSSVTPSGSGEGTTTGGSGSGGSNSGSGSGGSNSGSGSGGSNSGSGSGGSLPGPSNAIAALRSQLPTEGGGNAAATTGGGNHDPNDLVIVIGNPAVVCADPFEWICPMWKVYIGIPPSRQQPGTYDLSAPEFASSSFWIAPEGPGPGCSSGGGPFVEGTLEITTINNNVVTGQLIGTPATPYTFDANGPFMAARCP